VQNSLTLLARPTLAPNGDLIRREETAGVVEIVDGQPRKRLNVLFVIASNGHQFAMYDRITGITSKAQPMEVILASAELLTAYETGMGFSLESQSAKSPLVRYQGEVAVRQYYKDTEIRTLLEHVTKEENRALLSFTTDASKTFIAVHVLKSIVDAGLLRRA
jgi:type I restriction enzyme, R subunit